ncbi:MAG: ACT domain-containing protein [Erysipelotrichaceae bacterium]|nr:ACT domain-containing protein [Erysipelotrichaceae bacterium]
MSEDYMVVSTKILPKGFIQVAEAKKLLQDKKVENVSEACKMCGISRSTFYKYQDDVFFYNSDHKKKIVFSLLLSHETGALGKVCGILSQQSVSILTMSQSEPSGDVAPVMMSCDISKMKGSISDLKDILSKVKEVKKIEVLSID